MLHSTHRKTVFVSKSDLELSHICRNSRHHQWSQWDGQLFVGGSCQIGHSDTFSKRDEKPVVHRGELSHIDKRCHPRATPLHGISSTYPVHWQLLTRHKFAVHQNGRVDFHCTRWTAGWQLALIKQGGYCKSRWSQSSRTKQAITGMERHRGQLGHSNYLYQFPDYILRMVNGLNSQNAQGQLSFRDAD